MRKTLSDDDKRIADIFVDEDVDNKTDETTLRGTFIAEANNFNTRTTCEQSWFTWTCEHSEAVGGFVDARVAVGFEQLVAFYNEAGGEQRFAINFALASTCGWTLPELVEMAAASTERATGTGRRGEQICSPHEGYGKSGNN